VIHITNRYFLSYYWWYTTYWIIWNRTVQNAF